MNLSILYFKECIGVSRESGIQVETKQLLQANKQGQYCQNSKSGELLCLLLLTNQAGCIAKGLT